MNSSAFLILASLIVSSIPQAQSITVDNGVVDDPIVTCGDESINVKFNTRNPFNGRLFVKGEFGDPECRSLPPVNGPQPSNTEIDIGFTHCGVTRTRSANPPGIFLGVTLIISFHPQFISKVDKAYMVQCYYMEAMRICESEIQISMLTTAFQTATIPMPVCRYEVLSGDGSGRPVRYVKVGEQVYHKWTCETDTEDIFCMLVHSCKVDDGAGDSIQLLDAQGCAFDRHLLNNLDYPMDLMAGQEAHVFKYADRPHLYFDCQIAIAVKEPGSVCVRQQCPEPPRGKRSIGEQRQKRSSLVVTREVALVNPVLAPSTTGNQLDLDMLNQQFFAEFHHEEGNVCMEGLYLALYLAANLITVIASLSIFCASCRKVHFKVTADNF